MAGIYGKTWKFVQDLRSKEQTMYWEDPEGYEEVIKYWMLRDQVGERIAEYIKDRRPEARNVIETACGTGLITEHLATEGRKVIAVDPNKAMLNVARKKKPPTTDFLQGDFHDLGDLAIPEEWADLYLMIGGARYIERDDQFAIQTYNVLQQGGLAILSLADVNRKRAYELINAMDQNGLHRTDEIPIPISQLMWIVEFFRRGVTDLQVFTKMDVEA